jgi:hypothetical protein
VTAQVASQGIAPGAVSTGYGAYRLTADECFVNRLAVRVLAHGTGAAQMSPFGSRRLPPWATTDRECIGF